MIGWMQDFRFSARMLGRRPGMTALTMGILALGIASSATVFGWLDSVLLDPLPAVRDSAELVAVSSTTPTGSLVDLSYLDYLDLRDSGALAEMALFQSKAASIRLDGRPERIWSLFVTGSYFEFLGLQPALGRFFTPTDDRAVGSPAEVVLGHQYWQQRLGGDPAILGRVLEIDQQSVEVVGIAPPSFAGTMPGLRFDAWIPVNLAGGFFGHDWLRESRRWRWMHGLGRLHPGTTLAQAQARIDAEAERLAKLHPDENRGIGAAVMSFADAPFGAQSVLAGVLRILFAAVSLVLLVACANVAGLRLLQAQDRRKEVSVRLAMGAPGSRILRQLAIESLLLACLAASVSALALPWTLDVLRWILPASDLPISFDRQIGYRGWAFLLGASFLTTLFFGLTPALAIARTRILDGLRNSSRSSSPNLAGQRLLVMAQIALSVVAATGAGLFLKSLQHARELDPGFDREGVLLAQIDVAASGKTADQGLAFYSRLLSEAEGLPGVSQASLANWVPLGFGGISWDEVRVAGYVAADDENMKIWRAWVSDGYFDTLKIPILEGRPIDSGDLDPEAGVVVVNRAFARRFWPKQTAVGKELVANEQTYRVVGVAGDGKYRGLREEAQPMMYFSLWQRYESQLFVQLRGIDGDPMALAPALRQLRDRLDPEVPIFDTTRLATYTEASFAPQAMAARLLSGLAAMALLLSGAGIFGVGSHAVGRRTRELGLRVALGAQGRDIRRLIYRDILALALPGLGVGALLAVGASSTLGPSLLGVAPSDPWALIASLGLVLLISLLAVRAPLRRATHIAPTVALRED